MELINHKNAETYQQQSDFLILVLYDFIVVSLDVFRQHENSKWEISRNIDRKM
jgi:hypothetical protein